VDEEITGVPRPWWKDPTVWLPLVGFGGIILAFEGPNIASAVTDVISRGSHISYGTLNESIGIVNEDPEALRAAASQRLGIVLDADTYALARMIRSEGAAQGELRAHVALNDLADLGWSSLFYLLTYSTDPQRKGLYGMQYSPAVPPTYPKANARRYSTSQNPYAGDARLALKVLADRANGVDKALSAVKFLDKSGLLAQAGAKRFETTDASWRGEGLEPFSLPEYGTDLVLYRRG